MVAEGGSQEEDSEEAFAEVALPPYEEGKRCSQLGPDAFRAAGSALRGARRGAEVVAAGFFHRTASIFYCARRACTLAAAAPVVQPYLDTAVRALRELEHSEALRVRRIEDLPGIAAYLSQLGGQLEALRSELQLLPRPAVAMFALLALRLAAALNEVCDAALGQMLRGRNMLARVGFLATFTPGWLLVHHYRHVLLQDLGTGDRGDLQRLQAAVVLTRNARRMPPVFWLSTLLSLSMSVQVGKETCIWAIRKVLTARTRPMLAVAALCMVALRADRWLVVASDAAHGLASQANEASRSAASCLQAAVRQAQQAARTLQDRRRSAAEGGRGAQGAQDAEQRWPAQPAPVFHGPVRTPG